MGLKGDMRVIQDDISFFMNETASKGGCVSMSTAGSGVALDQTSALVTYAAAPSGKVPVGILVNEMVNIDQSRYSRNIYKDEVQQGGKVTLIKQGWVVTDMIEAGDTPTAGSVARLSHSGYLTSTSLGDAATPIVGRFDSTKDENGYAKLSINLP
jgi:hypothetical protein